MQVLNDYIREFVEYYFTKVHTSFPGVVTEYNAKTRRAIVQPSLKRKLGNKEFINLPLLIDVPVLYPGTKKYTIHFPLEKGDEVSVYFSERSLEVWKDNGQDEIEDNDPRRFSLSDAYCVPGLQPIEFIAAEEDALQIIHKSKHDGELISQVLMSDDKVEINYKKSIAELTDDIVKVENGKSTVKLNGDKTSIKNGSKSLFTILDTLLQALSTTAPTTLGSPAAHNWNPGIAQAITTAKTDIGLLLEA